MATQNKQRHQDKQVPKTVNGITEGQIRKALETLGSRLARTPESFTGSDIDTVNNAVRYTKLAVAAGVDGTALCEVWAKDVKRCLSLDSSKAVDMAERRTNAAKELGFDIANLVIEIMAPPLRID